MAFPGGSAYAMARDVGEGYLLVTERTFKTMTRSELDQIVFEMDRYLRELRGEPARPRRPAGRSSSGSARCSALNSALS